MEQFDEDDDDDVLFAVREIDSYGSWIKRCFPSGKATCSII